MDMVGRTWVPSMVRAGGRTVAVNEWTRVQALSAADLGSVGTPSTSATVPAPRTNTFSK